MRDRDYDDHLGGGRGGSSNELILNPGTYAYVQDTTKGNVKTYVGPIVVTQQGSLRPIRYRDGSFDEVSLQDAGNQCLVAEKGQYLKLHNPTKDDDGLKHPAIATDNTTVPDLRYGEEIVVPGPVQFAPWPEQSAEVVDGHQLRPDQYLLVRVYDEAAAKANWGNAVIEADDDADVELSDVEELDLTLGKLLIVKGVNFYIPCTGIEVVQNDDGEYVRDALTLEMGEYCILVDQSGDKRYERGPQIVFPEPTEEFFEEEGSIKFKPIELTPTQGLHLKFNCDYDDEMWPGDHADPNKGPRTFSEGDEVFITGATHPIYYPCEEHSIVRYGDNLVHFATAVANGDARYVMNKTTGDIETRHGPAMILLNPIDEVFVVRVLTDAESNLMYPGSTDSLEYNRSLRKFRADRGLESGDALSSEMIQSLASSMDYGAEVQTMGGLTRSARPRATKAALPDQIRRKTSYTKPHSVTLDDKFAGAPKLDVWNGFAVLLVKPDGTSRVEIGPQRVTLDYDETMQALHLSRGKPKTTDNLLTTGYLEVANNKVSDIIEVETSDGVRVRLKLSYRVSFLGDKSKWFNVDNYVKFLADHCRSRLKGEARTHTIRDFYADPVSIIRDSLLGKNVDGERKGLPFKENGMHITDIEILDVSIEDHTIESMLVAQQQEVITNQITIDRANQSLEVARNQSAVGREKLELEDEIRRLKHELKMKSLDDHETEMAKEAEQELARAKEQTVLNEQSEAAEDIRHTARLARETANLQLAMQDRADQTEQLVKRFDAAAGEFAAAINNAADKKVIGEVAEAMGPMRMFGGDDLGAALTGVLGSVGVPLLEKLTGSNE